MISMFLFLWLPFMLTIMFVMSERFRVALKSSIRGGFSGFQHLYRSEKTPKLTYPPLGFCNQQILGSKYAGLCFVPLNHCAFVFL